ncbi:MAG: glycosyltransferase family 1 protein [Firmicutes bacterium]|nr:glycosyltransferase family 1 protein [Bacillota bacterium]
MRIALFTETFLPSTDGIVTRLVATLSLLKTYGHEVAIVAPEGGPESYLGYPVYPVPGVPYFFYPQQRFSWPIHGVGTFLDHFRPDVVHVVNPLMLGLGGIIYARMRGLPLVGSFHTNLAAYTHRYGIGFIEPFSWWVMRTLHAQSTVNLATSRAMVAELRAHGFPRMRLWAGGVDTELFHPDKRDEAMRVRLLGRSGQADQVLLYVGRIAPEKQLDRLRSLLDAFPRLALAFVGDGPDRVRLEKVFTHPRAHFLGSLHGSELATAYASADGFIFPSTTETLGLSLFEALASGLAIVAATSPPSKEIVEGAQAGILFSANDQESLHDSVKVLLENRTLRVQWCQNARQAALKSNWEDPTDQLIKTYELAVRAHHTCQLGVRQTRRTTLIEVT